MDGVFRGVRVLDVNLGDDRALSYDDRGVLREEGQVTLGFKGDTRILHIHSRTGTVEIIGSTSSWRDPGY